MMILSTYPELLDNNCVQIHWKTGTKNGGVIKVEAPIISENIPLIAELCAIRHLLLRKNVLSCVPMSGKGISLHVSTGAIRKLMLGTSNKTQAIPYARFLYPRLDGIEIKTQRLTLSDFPLSLATTNNESIDIVDSYFEQPYDLIEGPAIGKVMVTAHAVEQYVNRCSAEVIKSPWKSLVNRLMHKELVQIPLPENVLKHKELKYGKNNHVEAWGHSTSMFAYLVVHGDNNNRTLVTVYRRAGSPSQS